MEYFELIKGFVLSPVETFQKVKDTDYGDTLVYFLVLVLINTVLSVPIMLITLSSMWTVFNGMFQRLGFGTLTGFGIVMFAVMMIIGALVLLFFGAAWLHLWVYLFGGRKGYRERPSRYLHSGKPLPSCWGGSPLSGCLEGSGHWSFSSWVFANSRGSQPGGRWEPSSLR